MRKIRATPKHNPGKFRTHLAQVRKHLELALAEHEKLEQPNTEAARRIRIELKTAYQGASNAWEWFVNDLRPSLPGYIEPRDEQEEAK